MTSISEANVGQRIVIQKITGDDALRNHLAEMGFIPNSEITVMNRIDGNLILQVKGSRIAIGKNMALQILY
jgi:ferrous iron transport protein A